jgi:hypothetical protein
MNVKEAVARAKEHVRLIYEDEQIDHLGLEEIAFDDALQVWDITLGFSRPWDQGLLNRLIVQQNNMLGRSFKIVRVKDIDGSVVSIRNRDVQTAS